MKDYLGPAILVLITAIAAAIYLACSPVQKVVSEASTQNPSNTPKPLRSAGIDTPAETDSAPESSGVAAPSPLEASRAISAASRPDRTKSKIGNKTHPPKNVVDELVANARLALASVGEDPAAEAVWMKTINDPSTPADARHDLIEDLNEDGFPDPKHLTPDDLPLIEDRIALVEDLGPDAIDDTNSAAFAEAYNDLLNMEAKVLGQ